MNKLTVTLETVTPLFMGGADQQPELRPASFRGALRFWWRALWGGTHGDDWSEMLKAEAKIFGDTKQASAIVVRTSQLTRRQIESMNEPAPHKGQIDYSYLLYGLAEREKKQGRPYLKYRSCVKSGEMLQVSSSIRPGAHSDNVWQSAYATLWLLTHLGGVGSRCRHGAGSTQVVNVSNDWSDDRLPALPISAQTPQALRNAIHTGIVGIKQTMGWSTYTNLQHLPQFDIIHPNFAEIYVLDKTWPDWKSALTVFARSMGMFRMRHDPDYKTIKAVAGGHGSNFQAERAAFGLPLPFYFSSTRDKAVVESQNYDRRASPLMLHVVRYPNKQYGLVVTFFKSILVPDGTLVAKGKKVGHSHAPVPDYGLVVDFLSALGNSDHDHHIAPMLRVKL